MTKFEQMLLDKGYIKCYFDFKTKRYKLAVRHIISTMTNLEHSYFHNTEKEIISKIENGKELSHDEMMTQITFGLNESPKPPTLICPRPNINIVRIRNGEKVIETEFLDDSMNIVLDTISHEEIYKAMFDKSICFNIDLTTK